MLKFVQPFRSQILACGAETKTTFCLTNRKTAWISNFFSDLKKADVFQQYKKEILAAVRKFKIKPQLIAHDLHPDYLSTRFAQDDCWAPIKKLAVQHHQAHIASCIAENRLSGRVLGIAFDGTGYGDDGELWGGEFFLCALPKFTRVGQLASAPLIGGEKAILEPWRMACSYLYQAFGKNFLKLKIDFVRKLQREKWEVLERMLEAKINMPQTSSAGRLFDAVSALLGITRLARGEAEAAINLEKQAKRAVCPRSTYPFILKKISGKYIVDFAPMFRQIVAEIKKAEMQAWIARKFHFSLASALVKVCLQIRDDAQVGSLVLSGGVFQNRIFLADCLALAKRHNFKVFQHNLLLPTDANISFGQAVIASAQSSSLLE